MATSCCARSNINALRRKEVERQLQQSIMITHRHFCGIRSPQTNGWGSRRNMNMRVCYDRQVFCHFPLQNVISSLNWLYEGSRSEMGSKAGASRWDKILGSSWGSHALYIIPQSRQDLLVIFQFNLPPSLLKFSLDFPSHPARSVFAFVGVEFLSLLVLQWYALLVTPAVKT